MGGLRRIVQLAVGLAVACSLTVLVGQASAAILRSTTSPAFVAVYGSPFTTEPIGNGLGMDFGFGENFLFEATEGKSEQVSLRIGIGKILGSSTLMASEDLLLGATLMSNKSSKGAPLSLAIQFADFQKNKISNEALTKGTLAPAPVYTDTFDRRWLTEICSPGVAANECKTDPRFFAAAGEGQVHIQDVTILIGAQASESLTMQGDLWGVWNNGSATKPPCVTFNLPPAGATASQTLRYTESPGAAGGFPSVGEGITAISGKACLVSANNDYFAGNTPAIEIANE